MGVASYIYTFTFTYLLCAEPGANALAHPPQSILVPAASPAPHTAVQPNAGDHGAGTSSSQSGSSFVGRNNTGHDLLYALAVMQGAYFELWQGTWPSSIDWTAAVLNTDVGGTLLSLSAAADPSSSFEVSNGNASDLLTNGRAFENMINHFFDQSAAFYFGENAVGLRSQAFDDMQWVVLDWLENIKFQELHSDLHYNDIPEPWHGTQYRVPAAHRARLFYHLASSEGWNTTLCGGGMLWSPYTTPYKNAITNELYISSSIGMYLYHPGDEVDSPFVIKTDENPYRYPHNLVYLHNAIKAYDWFKNSNMTGACGLIADGFHIRGWKSPENPGTQKCDVFNPMLYTYNQGVFLSGLRGLWLATLSAEYLHDGHEHMARLIAATGWPNTSSGEWAGLGRGGVLEDTCDSAGDCSQDGQTFKGIFFHHLTEFCRPPSPQEHRFLQSSPADDGKNWRFMFDWHQARCRLYRPWIEHNAHAALVTRDRDGKFGMWWGVPYNPDESSSHARAAGLDSPLPAGAVDYRNYYGPGQSDDGASEYIAGLEKPNPPQQTGLKNSDDLNDRGRGRTVETQSGGITVLRALYQWKHSPDLAESVV